MFDSHSFALDSALCLLGRGRDGHIFSTISKRKSKHKSYLFPCTSEFKHFLTFYNCDASNTKNFTIFVTICYIKVVNSKSVNSLFDFH